MMGYTGSFAINGTKITLQPEEFNWEDFPILGRDGNGKPIYPAIGEFKLQWGFMTTSEFKQINDFYNTILVTGTAVVDLPKWGDDGYLFYSYSGTHLNRPVANAYFNQYVKDVTLLVTNIRV